jgi:CRP-like cAMP-binding protein
LRHSLASDAEISKMNFYNLKLNNFLAALPAHEFERVASRLELVSLDHGEVLYSPGMPMQYLYFPIDCIVSLLHEKEDGNYEEIAITGKEGVVGVDLMLAGISAFNLAVVGATGCAYRLRYDTLFRDFPYNSPLQILLLRYTQVVIRQMMYTGMCKRRHSLEQQMCRWLLSSLDRLPSMQLKSTHKLMAEIMGADIESVSEVTHKLEDMGLVYCQHKMLSITDRSKLEALACNCYRRIKQESESWVAHKTQPIHRPSAMTH